MYRKKILWLVSWYPNKNDRFDGDFIQRHARAAAIYHDVHVIFVTDTDMQKLKDEEWNYSTGLTEQIIYFKKKKGITAKILKQLAWKNIFQQAVKNYIEKNGLPDCVHVHIPWKAGLVALWIKKKYNRDFVITEHWGYYNKEIENNFFTASRVVQKLVKVIYKESKAVVSVSNFLANEIESVTGKKCNCIIPNVVDTSLFFPANKKYSKFTFVHISNMVYWKNVEKILEAFIEVRNEKKDIQLILIGNRSNKYVNMARNTGVLNDCVFFKGEMPYREVAEELKLAHCHVLFGNFETFSCVTAESLCSGVPVIVPSAGALNELVNKKNGIIVLKNDVVGLSKAMMEMIDNYRTFNPLLISQEASKRFSYSSIALQFEELYRNFC
jgi:glycosyltransferase involved in cell wall biosynthesis